MTVSWADTHISASHRSDEGVLHGHTWRVRAFWNYDGESIVERKALLEKVCRRFDHTVLPEHLRRAEDFAGYIGDLIDAVKVDVWREAEGLGASWP